MTDKLLDEFTTLDVIKYFEYLDKLRDSGVTNMFGAAPYLTREFAELDIHEARTVLGAWGETFDGESSAEDRAYKAMGKSA